MIDGHLAGRLAVLTAPFNVELVHFRIEPYWNVRILRCVIEPVAAALVAVFFEFAADHTERNAVVRNCTVLANTETSSALLAVMRLGALAVEDP
jgi:hypothetical protein